MRQLVLFFCFAVNYCSAQQFTVAADRMNIMYKGWSSPISVTVQGVHCKDITIQGDSVDISSYEEDSCKYYVVPKKTGLIMLEIYKQTKNGKVLVGKSRFRSKEFPDPLAQVGTKRNDTIRKNTLAPQLGVLAVLHNCDCDARIVVQKYSMIIVREGQTIFTKKAYSSLFDDETKSQLKLLRDNDLVFIYDIFVAAPSYSSKMIEPIYLTVKE